MRKDRQGYQEAAPESALHGLQEVIIRKSIQSVEKQAYMGTIELRDKAYSQRTIIQSKTRARKAIYNQSSFKQDMDAVLKEFGCGE